MIFEKFPEPFDVLVIKETFDSDESLSILNEIGPFSNKSQDGDGVWLTDIYKDLDMSATHTNTMQSFFNGEVLNALLDVNSLYRMYSSVNNHSTQLRYLNDDQQLPLRFDSAAFTLMTFLFDDPKNFEGGNVTLQIDGDIAYEQNIENNMTIVFPSAYYVGLSKINITDKSRVNSGLHIITSYLFIQS